MDQTPNMAVTWILPFLNNKEMMVSAAIFFLWDENDEKSYTVKL